MAALLPWRRSKLVLVEGPSSSSSSSSSSGSHGEGPGKVKALGLALGYCSLLAHLVRACPTGLWPPGPPPRERLLGRICRRRRRTVELNGPEPVYSAWYLGNAITLQAQGGAEEAVERIWAKSQGGARSSPMRLALGPYGLRLSPAESSPGGRRPSHAYLLHRITYCGPDRRRPRILAWVYRHQVKHKAVVLRCHAVLLSRAEKAQAVARRLGQACRSAFDDFRRLKRRDDARHRQRQLLGEAILPPVPLRRLLNGKCPYRPPLDRGRGALRLSAIQEEEEEEEEKMEKKEEHRLPPNSSSGPSATHKVSRMQAIFGANGSLTTAAVAVAGTVAARFSLSPTESTKETICATGAVAGRLSLGTADSVPTGKAAQGLERSEVLSLARDLHFCTLQGPLPKGDPLCPREDHPGGPLCSGCQRLGSRCQILPREREEGGGSVGRQALV